MANESVTIPVSLEVTDISMEQIDLKDVQQKLSQRVSGITKSIESIMSNTDTSKFNKALESSFNSIEKSCDKVNSAYARYNDAVRKAGESSEQYKVKLAEVNGAIQNQQDIIKAMAPLASNPVVQAEIEKAKQEIAQLETTRPDPMDYVSTGSESAITTLVQRYRDLVKAITSADNAQKDWNTSLKENRATDEYMQMAKAIQVAEQKLVKLQEKATRMESLGATDKQWESLVYDADQLSKSITDNEAKMRKLVNTGKAFRFGDGGSAKGQEFMKLTGILSRTQKAMQNINSMKPNTMYSEEYSKQVKELEALERKLMSYQDKYQKMQSMGASGIQWKSFLTDASMLEGKIQEVITKLQEMVDTGKAFKLGTGDATAETNALNDRLTSVTNSMNEMQNAPKNVKSNILPLIRVINNFCNSAKKGLANVISQFKKLGKTSGHTSKSVGKSTKKMLKDIVTFMFGVRSVYALIRRLRRIFIESFKEMATQIPEVNTQISSFITSLNQIKGSLATAFQPIVSAIIPWLNQLIASLNVAMNTLAKFFATLTGQGYIYKFTAAQVDYAESLDKTGSAAKDAQKSLMGFDEINRLNGDSGSGGGAGGETPTGTWEKEMMDGMNTLAQMIKEAWTDGDFSDVGQYIGEKLLLSLQTANNWIVTKGYALADKIGNSLATLINGVIATKDLGIQLGTAMANGVNMGMIGIHQFLTTTNWLNLGQFIADWANSVVTNFQWDLLGQTIAGVITAAVNTWWKFVGEFDFSALGKGISTSLNNLFNNLLSVDETGLSSAEKLGQSITGTIKGILRTITDAINNTDWASVGKTIGEVLSNIDWSSITWDLTKLVGAFVKALAEAFINWTATDPLSAGIASMLGLALVTIDLGSKVTGLIITFYPIVKFVKDLGLGFSEVIKIVGGWAKIFGGVMSIVSGAITFFSNFIAMLVNGFSWVNEILMIVGAALVAVGAILLGAPALVAGIVAGIVAAVSTLVVLIKEHWNAIWTFLQNAWEVLKQTIIAVLQGIFATIVGILGAIVSTIIAVLGTIITVIGTMIATIVGVIKSAIAIIVGIITTVLTTIVGIITGVLQTIHTVISTVLNLIKTVFSTVFQLIVAIVTGNFGSVQTIITNAINTVQTIISGGINSVKNVWSNVWNTISSITSSIWGGISSTIKGTINGIIGFVNGMIRGIINGMNSVVGVLNKLQVDVPDWVPEIGGSKFGFNLPKMSAPQIPYLAKGAVIPPNKEFMAMLGDQKHGTNIEAPLDTIKQAVAEELAEYIDAMMTGFQAVVDAVNDKDFDVRIGDNAIGKAAERYSKRQALVRGTT